MPRPMTAERMRRWRGRNSYSQSQLAEALGVHDRTISKWENDQRAIPPFMGLALEALRRRRLDRERGLPEITDEDDEPLAESA